MLLTSFSDITYQLLEGFLVTFKIFFYSLIFSLPLGLIVTFGSMSKFKPLKVLIRGFIWIIRGTPLMLQVIVVFYGPGLWFNYPIKSRLIAVIIAFVINYACYFSEIYRSGIESISEGQKEAGQVLGMRKSQIFFQIIFPQVLKRIIPPISNEVMTLVKDTSLARVIALSEVIMIAQETVRMEGILWPLFYTGVFYLIFNGLLTIIFAKLEKKLDYYRG
ncbi:MAG: amino acid ABC transporter permease [Bacilli bacterium]|jgi:polar amino acid transport system permease protein|nr:amino acid ABC transporter permease [Bacilli bacterium]MDY0209442.1 amino acid ABC transporter permease [Bacilli bacterium]